MRLLCAALLLEAVFAGNRNSRPQYTENSEEDYNYSPATADPKGSIRCVGPRPQNFNLPAIDGWNVDVATVQQICAKPEYGGQLGPHGPQGLGGYCFWNDPYRLGNGIEPRVRFDRSAKYTPRDNAPSLYFTRLALLCRERCFCDKLTPRFLPPLRFKPKAVPIGYHATFRFPEPHSFLEIELDRRGKGEIMMPAMQHQRQSIRSTKVEWGDQRAEITGHSVLDGNREEFISLSPDNEIECLRSNIPYQILRIPRPFARFRYDDILSLCAVNLSLGKTNSNAGGYCHNRSKEEPSYRGSPNERDVWFTDDMTPRAEWTWADNFPFAARLRGFCFSSCWCRGANAKKELENHRRIMEVGWMLNEFTRVYKTPGGSYKVDSARQLSMSQYEGSFHGGSTRIDTDENSRQCILNGECIQEPWPVEKFGPLPNQPPERIGQEILPMCGQSCNGPASLTCSGAKSNSDCKCVALTSSQTRLLGLDSGTLPGTGLCLAVSLLAQLTQKGQRLGGRLNPREMEMALDLQSGLNADWNCVCNSTYTSSFCCDSDSGVIHNEPKISLQTAPSP